MPAAPDAHDRVRRRPQPVRGAHLPEGTPKGVVVVDPRRLLEGGVRPVARPAARRRAWPGTAGRHGTSSTAASATAAATRRPSTTSPPRSTPWPTRTSRSTACSPSATPPAATSPRGPRRAAGSRGGRPGRLTGVVSQAGVLDLGSAYDDASAAGAVVRPAWATRPDPDDAPLDPRRQVPLDVPVHCVHGTADDVVPVSQSQQLRRGGPRRGRDGGADHVEGGRPLRGDRPGRPTRGAQTLAILDGL